MLERFVPIFQKKDGSAYYSSSRWTRSDVPRNREDELTDMVYDFSTKVVYYAVYDGKKCVFRHPYISENGKYCRFIDEKIVEVQ